MPCNVCGSDVVSFGLCPKCQEIKNEQMKSLKSSTNELERQKREQFFGKTGRVNLNEVVGHGKD